MTWCCNNKISSFDYDTIYNKYYIPNSKLTDINNLLIKNSWKYIISNDCLYFITNNTNNNITPITLFYDTFFDILKSKHDDDDIVLNIYKNNLKLKSKSMIGLVSIILNDNNNDFSIKKWNTIIEMHKNIGVKKKHFFLIGIVLIETLDLFLNKHEQQDIILYEWKKKISYIIDIITLKHTYTHSHSHSYI